MSAMKELYLKVAADTMLQEKVGKILEAAGEDADAAGTKLVEFAKEQGYDITGKEIGEFFKSLSETSNEPLDDEDLEAVAGGKFRPGGNPMLSFGPMSGNCGINPPLISIGVCGGFRLF